MAQAHPPFNDDDRIKIDDALSSVQAARDTIARAERAGHDMSAKKRELDEAEKRLRGTRQQFFER